MVEVLQQLMKPVEVILLMDNWGCDSSLLNLKSSQVYVSSCYFWLTIWYLLNKSLGYYSMAKQNEMHEIILVYAWPVFTTEHDNMIMIGGVFP